MEETIGQYTGLTDKNGKRIFEGDILKSYFIFQNGSAWCLQQNGFEHVPACADMISDISEVVGNTHDNPELMKDEK